MVIVTWLEAVSLSVAAALGLMSEDSDPRAQQAQALGPIP